MRKIVGILAAAVFLAAFVGFVSAHGLYEGPVGQTGGYAMAGQVKDTSCPVAMAT